MVAIVALVIAVLVGVVLSVFVVLFLCLWCQSKREIEILSEFSTQYYYCLMSSAVLTKSLPTLSL